MDHSNGKEVIYDAETDSFFTLIPLTNSDSAAWEITCKGPIKMPIDIKVREKSSDLVAEAKISAYAVG